jgi:hypothetical protein
MVYVNNVVAPSLMAMVVDPDELNVKPLKRVRPVYTVVAVLAGQLAPFTSVCIPMMGS